MGGEWFWWVAGLEVLLVEIRIRFDAKSRERELVDMYCKIIIII